MPFVRPGSPAYVTLAIGQTLVVTAEAGSIGAVTLAGARPHMIRSGPPVNIGRPGKYTLEADTGSLAYTLQDPLSGALTKATDIVRSARIIQTALIQGRKMALADKFALLAARSKSVPAALSDMADKVLGDFDGVEQEGNAAFAALDTIITDAKAAVSVAKDAVNQLNNGAPA